MELAIEWWNVTWNSSLNCSSRPRISSALKRATWVGMTTWVLSQRKKKIKKKRQMPWFASIIWAFDSAIAIWEEGTGEPLRNCQASEPSVFNMAEEEEPYLFHNKMIMRIRFSEALLIRQAFHSILSRKNILRYLRKTFYTAYKTKWTIWDGQAVPWRKYNRLCWTHLFLKHNWHSVL